MDRLILFDIDGTLTKGPGHRDAFSHASRAVYGIDAEQPREGNPGMTDWQIILDILTEKGLGRQEISEKIRECMDEMARYYEASMPGRTVEVHNGVKELLSELEGMAVMTGLVTGNVEGVAWAKLGKAGIGHHFKMGGFGSDDISRANLVGLAVRRAVKLGFNRTGRSLSSVTPRVT
jgi:phosphoglycolate phosphatase